MDGNGRPKRARTAVSYTYSSQSEEGEEEDAEPVLATGNLEVDDPKPRPEDDEVQGDVTTTPPAMIVDEDETVDPVEAERREWARQMRLKFTPAKMINEAGLLKDEYFRPKSMKVAVRNWGEEEERKLVQGIEEHGMGAWTTISTQLLPDWKPTELSVKSKRLIGAQSIARYRGWKGNVDDIALEKAKNKAIGELYDCWKGGVLVYDEQGKVEAHLKADKSAAKDA